MACAWDRFVARKVPGAWPAAVAELRAVQQFAPPTPNPPSPLPPIPPLLSRLRTLGGTDKHRNLTLFATGAWSQSAITPPEMKEYYAVDIFINQPGPVLPIVPGKKVEVSRVSVAPNFARHPDTAFTWTSGIQFDRPLPPEVAFGFRANDGTQIDAAELATVIDLVESIAQRFVPRCRDRDVPTETGPDPRCFSTRGTREPRAELSGAQICDHHTQRGERWSRTDPHTWPGLSSWRSRRRWSSPTTAPRRPGCRCRRPPHRQPARDPRQQRFESSVASHKLKTLHEMPSQSSDWAGTPTPRSRVARMTKRPAPTGAPAPPGPTRYGGHGSGQCRARH